MSKRDLLGLLILGLVSLYSMAPMPVHQWIEKPERWIGVSQKAWTQAERRVHARRSSPLQPQGEREVWFLAGPKATSLPKLP